MTAAERQRPPPGELCLDHLGHFVPDLDAAAAVWEKLGFKVTPTSVHQVSGKPAGTANPSFSHTAAAALRSGTKCPR